MKTRNSFLSKIGTLFLSGLLTILPLTLTIALFNISYKMLKSILRPVYHLEPECFRIIPASEFLLTLLIILIIGLIMRVFFLRSIVDSIERLISKIPLLRPTYAGIKQLVQAFNPHDHTKFKKVVLVEFPAQNCYSIGFLTGNFHPSLTPDSQVYWNVFIPMTPNPTHGFFVITQESRVKVLNISRQEAMALIISGGIIQPERLAKSEAPR